MQYSITALAALVAGAAASYNGTVAYTTEVHTAYTTVCPASTQLTFNGVTYTATASTVLTITNCPCTIVKPVTTSSVVATTPAVPVVTSSAVPVYSNSTTPAAPVVPVTSATPTKAAVGTTSAKTTATTTPFTGAANKAMTASGAGLAGLIGLAAYIL